MAVTFLFSQKALSTSIKSTVCKMSVLPVFRSVATRSHRLVGPRRIPFSPVQSLSCVRLSVTPWTTAHQASLCVTNSQSPPKPMSIESVMPSSHLILCHPLLLLPPILPYLNGLVVFPTFFSLRLNLAIRSSWSEPQSSPGLVFADCIELLHHWLQRI